MEFILPTSPGPNLRSKPYKSREEMTQDKVNREEIIDFHSSLESNKVITLLLKCNQNEEYGRQPSLMELSNQVGDLGGDKEMDSTHQEGAHDDNNSHPQSYTNESESEEEE